MAEENVELVRGGFALFREGRMDEWIAMFDEDIEWDISAHPLPDFPDRGRGRDALAAHLGEYFSGWIDYSAEEREVIAAGDEVYFVLRERATMRGTEVVLDREIVIAWTVSGGRMTRFRVFRSLADARAADAPG